MTQFHIAKEFHSKIQYLIKNGRDINIMPIKKSKIMLSIKYGKAHKTTPESNAIPLRCFLPYIKYPAPIAPNNRLMNNDIGLPMILSLSVFLHIRLA